MTAEIFNKYLTINKFLQNQLSREEKLKLLILLIISLVCNLSAAITVDIIIKLSQSSITRDIFQFSALLVINILIINKTDRFNTKSIVKLIFSICNKININFARKLKRNNKPLDIDDISMIYKINTINVCINKFMNKNFLHIFKKFSRILGLVVITIYYFNFVPIKTLIVSLILFYYLVSKQIKQSSQLITTRNKNQKNFISSVCKFDSDNKSKLVLHSKLQNAMILDSLTLLSKNNLDIDISLESKINYINQAFLLIITMQFMYISMIAKYMMISNTIYLLSIVTVYGICNLALSITKELTKFTVNICELNELIQTSYSKEELAANKNTNIALQANFNKNIFLNNISFKYNSKVVFTNISFNITPKQNIAILGNKHTGKSTLANIISGKIRPTKGTIKIYGLVPHLISQEYKDNVVSIIPKHSIIKPTNIYDNINKDNLYSLEDIFYIMNNTKLQSIAEQLNIDLTDNIKNPLNATQKQFIGIMRAVLTNSQCIIADEATCHMSKNIESQLWDILFYIWQNKNIIILTNNLRIAQKTHTIISINTKNST